MSARTILVDLSAKPLARPLLEVAQAIARQQRATVIGLHVMPIPIAPAFFSGTPSMYFGPELIEAQRKASREIRDQVRAIFGEVCGDSANAIWREAGGDPDRLLATAARTTDMVILGKGESQAIEAYATIEDLLVAAGVPVMVMPAGSYAGIGATIMVGWNGSREATRAVHGALPFLVGAKRVILCAVGEARHTLEDARLMLRRHDVAVEPKHVDAPDSTAGEVMLAQAGGEGVDLLVMGAYGHTRLRELVFGGATRHVLHGAAIPVLFSG